LNKRKDIIGEKNYPSRLRGRGVDFDDSQIFLLYALAPFFRVFFLKNGGRSTAMSTKFVRHEEQTNL